MNRLYKERSPWIGELLVAAKAVTEEQVAEALETQREDGGLLGRILIEAGACTAEDVIAAVGKQVRFTRVDLGRITPQPQALRLLRRDVCQRRGLLPFEVLGDWLCLAMVNVVSKASLIEVADMTGLRPRGFKATRNEIVAAIGQHYLEE